MITVVNNGAFCSLWRVSITKKVPVYFITRFPSPPKRCHPRDTMWWEMIYPVAFEEALLNKKYCTWIRISLPNSQAFQNGNTDCPLQDDEKHNGDEGAGNTSDGDIACRPSAILGCLIIHLIGCISRQHWNKEMHRLNRYPPRRL